MIEVRLFSRRCGWPGGKPIGMFYSPIFHIPKDIYQHIEDKRGKFVFQVMQDNGISIPDEVKMYDNWYCYTADTQLTSCDSI